MHAVITLVFMLVLAVVGGNFIGLSGVFFGAVLGLLAGNQLRLNDRVLRLEAAARHPSLAPRAPEPQPAPVQPAQPVPQSEETPPVPPPARLQTETPAPPPASVIDGSDALPPRPPRRAPQDDALTRAFHALRVYATTGNVVAKAGVLLLFFGVAFLLKYAIDRNVLPVEVRLAGTAAAAIALLVTGFRLRGERRTFGLLLQGAGTGLLYLTAFAATRLYHVLPVPACFALMVAVVVLSGVLAVRQDSRALATLGAAGGFLAPVLASTGEGSHVVLFSYYALLNLGIVGIAWFKAWRSLNLTGFLFTFVIGSQWGHAFYRPEFFASVEPFLVLSFVFYLAVSVLFALRRPPELRGYVDGTLVFGLPAIVFALQSRLVSGIPFAEAWSAVGMGAAYLGAATWLGRLKRAELAMFTEALLALGVLALSLAIPLAFDGHLTAAAWALEGTGLVWIGLRQDRWLARVAGAMLAVAAGVAFLLMDSATPEDALPFLNARFLGGALIGAGALASSCLLSRGAAALRPGERYNGTLLLLWGLCWWLVSGADEIDLHTERFGTAATLAFQAASAMVLARIARPRGWTGGSAGAAGLVILLALRALGEAPGDGGPVADLRMLGWCLALGACWHALRLAEDRLSRQWLARGHALALWLLVFVAGWMLAWSARWSLGLGSGWVLAGWLLPVAAAIALLPTQRLQGIWPVQAFAGVYRGDALLALALAGLAAILFFAGDEGSAAPLPFVPLLNPLELVSAGLVLATALAWRTLAQRRDAPGLWWRTWLPRVLGGVGFVALNVATARAVHHLAAVPYALADLHRSPTFQGSVSVLWGVCALALMVVATRRGWRALWLCGGALLAALVAKLFFVDLGDRGTVARIVSFIAAGALMLLIGYLSPAPPRRAEEHAMKSLVLTLLAAALPAAAAPSPATPTDYASGFELHTVVTAPAYRVALEADVYRQLHRQDLGDLAVFNSGGQPVPQALERPEENATLPAQRPLPFYAIAQEGSQIAGPLKLRVDAGGAVVQMETPADAPDAQGSRAWIIDAGEERAGISALRLAWDGAPEGFLRHARLETGEELGAWRALGETTLADLERNGARLVQDTFTLPAPPARYLRLRLDAGTGITLRTVLALSDTGPAGTGETFTPLTPVADPDTGGWLIDTGGPLPVEHLRVRLTADNDMAEFDVFSRSEADSPWQPRGRVLAYRLRTGEALLEGGDARTDLTRDRYWSLRPVGAGRSPPADAPRVDAGWTPDELVFLARGGGPYTLAAGSGATPMPAQAMGKLWQSVPGGAEAVQIAAIGGMRELGGAAALEPAREPVPWQRYLMWALLVGAVLLLGLMARSLLRTTSA